MEEICDFHTCSSSGFLSPFSLNFIEIFVVFLIFFKNKRLLTGYFNYQLIFVAKSSSRGRRREEKGKEAGNACTRESFSNCPKNETKRSLELHCSNSWISRVRVEEGRRIGLELSPVKHRKSRQPPSVALL